MPGSQLVVCSALLAATHRWLVWLSKICSISYDSSWLSCLVACRAGEHYLDLDSYWPIRLARYKLTWFWVLSHELTAWCLSALLGS